MRHKVKRLIEKPILAGIISAIMVISYCGIITIFFKLSDTVFPNDQDFLQMAFILILMVLSAGVCGILVFGLPIFYLVQKQVKESGLYMAANLSSFVFFLVIIANIILLTQITK